MKPLRFISISLLLIIGLSSCSSTSSEHRNSPYTHGNVQLNLKKGITTKTEVLEKFGAPNIATTDSSELEVWTYQKHATISKNKENGVFGTLIILSAGSSSSSGEQSSRTMTLIIKFGKDDKVSDFKSMYTSF